MTQTAKFPRLIVRNKPNADGKVTVGANVSVSLDEKPLNNLSFLKIEIKATKVAKVTMEMYVQLDIDMEVPDGLKVVEEKDLNAVHNGKALIMRTLSNYAPTGVALKKT